MSERLKYAPAMSGSKRCRTCGEEKDVTDFWANSWYADGRESRCASCSKTAVREINRRARAKYRAEHAAEELARGNAWRRRNRDRVLRQRNELRFEGNYELVLRRDRYRCTDCGTSGRRCSEQGVRLVVHHIDGRSYHNSDNPNSDPKNLVTLCRSCHSRRHVREMGRPDERGRSAA